MSLCIRTFLYSIAITIGAVVIALALLLLGSLWPGEHGYDIRIVESGSMEPTIPVGAVILTRPEPIYQVNDVVTYQRRTDTSATTHRLVEAVDVEGEPAFMTQGDANNVTDLEPVLMVEIAGRVWSHLPYVGYVLSFFRSPVGFIILVMVPAMFIVWEQVVRIRRVIKENKNKTTE